MRLQARLISLLLMVFSPLWATPSAAQQDYHRAVDKVPVSIRAHGFCKRVTTLTGQDVFVPTRDPKEWLWFRQLRRPDIQFSECASWSTGSWGNCSGSANVNVGQWSGCQITSSNGCRGHETRSVTCSPGQGTQTRSVACVDELGNNRSDYDCTGPKPIASQSCSVACEYRNTGMFGSVLFANGQYYHTYNNCSICGGGSMGDR